jgi:poly(hydroxyalkanoate) depolymerase family esterase
MDVIDGCVYEGSGATSGRPGAALALRALPLPASARQPASGPAARASTAPSRTAAEARRAAAAGPGDFISGSFVHGGGALDYKLYVPPGAAAVRPRPLVVMLHGCTQDPDDFAAGTGMNACAREQGFYVLYPAQSKSANPQRCWNWFKHGDQQRGHGEPAVLAALTRQMMKDHGVDPRRVYVAGLSAGGAMAAIVAEAYPELFAAVGIHSGLPIGAASNLSEALSAMRGSAAAPAAPPHVARPRGAAGRPVPAIVFHGDQDHTVHQRNGEHLIAAVLASDLASRARPARGTRPAVRVENGVTDRGRRFTRSVHVGGQGAPVAEHWLVHGAGHAWSGGYAAGSYTDTQGPDATREMLRFFFEHPHANPGLQ